MKIGSAAVTAATAATFFVLARSSSSSAQQVVSRARTMTRSDSKVLLQPRALQEESSSTCPSNTDGYENLIIKVKFDSYPRDFKVELRNEDSQEAIWERDDPSRNFNNTFKQSYATLQACVPTSEACWRLTVYDARNDGLTYNAKSGDVGGGFRILLNDRTIDYYTGAYNGCFSTKWYRFGSGCEQGQMGYVQYGYVLDPDCDTFVWDFSPEGILPYADLTEPLPGAGDAPTDPPLTPAPTRLPTRLPTQPPPVPAPTTSHPTLLPTDPPLVPVPVPVSVPTRLPTRVPTPSSSSPSGPFDTDGEPCTALAFTLTVMDEPWKITYRLDDKLNNQTLWSASHASGGGSGAQSTTSVFQSSCLEAASSCYTFTIVDDDYGSTASPKKGSYLLALDGTVVGRYSGGGEMGGTYGGVDGGCFRKRWYTFGGECPRPNEVAAGAVPEDGSCV